MTQKSPDEKKIITVYVSKKLLTKARKYGINISKAASDGIQAAIEREEKLKALTENKSEDNLTYQ